MKITIMGIDLAKKVFQIHGVEEHGKVVVRKQLKRKEMAKYFANLAPCDWHESMRWCPLLGAEVGRLRASGQIDGTAIRQAICQNEQERHGRCGGNL